MTNTTILAKDRHLVYRLQRELRSNFTDDIKAKKRAKLDGLINRSSLAVQARKDSLPANLRQSLPCDLPVVGKADDIIQAICNHQVVIVAGETGSGKTTQLPKLALLAGRGTTGQIAHTQPRRLAARSVANRIADELSQPLGQTVSFKVRFSEEGSKDSLIKLMTDGILLAELGFDRFLTRYDTIIIDEAHERSLNIDFILGYLKQLLPKRPDLKVIITSATLDTGRFADYFGGSRRVPIINVEGRSYPVEVRYRPLVDDIVTSHDDEGFEEIEDKLPRALIAAVNECLEDARQKGQPHKSDILIFASTEAQIRELADVLSTHAPAHTQVLPLYARQSVAEQQKIFAPTGGRRIIISTNVAETALTVPNIYYVIDLGFARMSRYDYRSRIQRLPIEAISQASANQRKGRCGRIGAGVCIRLYSEEDFEARPQFTQPEILRTNLASVILQMQYLGLGEVADFEFLTPPDFRLVNDGKKLLHELGAITQTPTKTALKKRKNTPSCLTAIGQKMAKMPIDPRLARMLIAGDEFDCLSDMLKIVSALGVQDVRERPADKQTQADQKHALFYKPDSDFLFYVHLYQILFGEHEWHGGDKLTGNGRKHFAKKHYLSFARIKEWQKTHEQLSQMMTDLGFDVDKIVADEADGTLTHTQSPLKLNKKSKKTAPFSKKSSDEPMTVHYVNLHRALLTALLSFVAHKTETVGEYVMARGQKARIFPASVVHKKAKEWVMSFEVVQTSQVYLRCVAKIDPEWILSAGKALLKYHYFEPHWSKKAGRVKAYAQVSLFGLVIVHKQPVSYEQIDLQASREIFIQDALVANNYPKALAFLTHNEQKIQHALTIEDKLRRKDLLVDEQALYDFYDQKIPNHVACTKAFEDWLGEVGDEGLYFEDADILRQTAHAGQDFPEYWQLGALRLPLSYVFDPSCEDDGVSVKVPIQALSQIDGVALLWGIAGWRFELVSELLKTLPKPIRKQIVPIPDTAQAIFDKLDPTDQFGLLDQLCQHLHAKGIAVSPSDFRPDDIAKHLKPLVCVVDGKNRVIDKGRDVNKLQLAHRHDSPQDVYESQVGDEDFAKHFRFVKSRHNAGVVMQVFYALTPVGKQEGYGERVVMAEFFELSQAVQAHQSGVLSLIKARLGAKQKQLVGQIDKAFRLAFAPLGDLEKLKTRVVDATLQVALQQHGVDFEQIDPTSEANHDRLAVSALLTPKLAHTIAHLPLSKAEFELSNAAINDHFLSVGQDVLVILKDIYTTWQTVRGQLLMLERDVFGESIDDIEDQLDDLCLSDFIYRIGYEHWRHYPRYLSAIKIRLERLIHNLDNDLAGVYALDEHMERLANRRHDPKFGEYRWLVEEYRIHLFAQPMKTAVSVSQKRLEKAWAKANTQ